MFAELGRLEDSSTGTEVQSTQTRSLLLSLEVMHFARVRHVAFKISNNSASLIGPLHYLGNVGETILWYSGRSNNYSY